MATLGAFLPHILEQMISIGLLHCKYIRRNYDGTLAIHRSTTMIPCRDQLQCSTWKFLIQNSITPSPLIAGSQFKYKKLSYHAL